MSLVQNHQVNIMVVDPDASAREMIHEVMISDGYGCRAVDSMAAALSSARAKRPDLLICDMNLEDGTALQLLRQLNSISACPAIFLSDSRDPDMIRFARSGGATFFLAKPLDTDVLIELVDKALWMPHLVRRHVDTSSHTPHRVKAPTFSLSNTAGTPQKS